MHWRTPVPSRASVQNIHCARNKLRKPPPSSQKCWTRSAKMWNLDGPRNSCLGRGHPAVGPGVVGRAHIADLPGPHVMAPKISQQPGLPSECGHFPASLQGTLTQGDTRNPSQLSWRQGIPVPTMHAIKSTGQLSVNLAPNLCFS